MNWICFTGFGVTCVTYYSGPCGDVCHLGHYKNY